MRSLFPVCSSSLHHLTYFVRSASHTRWSGFFALVRPRSTKNGEVCASDTQPAAQAIAAIKNCFSKGGHMCTHGDMFQLAGSGHNPWSGGGNGWYGDHGFASGGNVDDEYMTWNRNHYTTNNDGPAYHSNSKSLPYRCCSTAPGTVCPAGFKLVGAQCTKDESGTKTYYDAQDTCKADGAHICSHGEMMEMCANGANPYAGNKNGWFGDHGTTTGGNWDDEFLTWNRNFCDPNNDGAAKHSNGAHYGYRCCKQAATAPPADTDADTDTAVAGLEGDADTLATSDEKDEDKIRSSRAGLFGKVSSSDGVRVCV